MGYCPSTHVQVLTMVTLRWIAWRTLDSGDLVFFCPVGVCIVVVMYVHMGIYIPCMVACTLHVYVLHDCISPCPVQYHTYAYMYIYTHMHTHTSTYSHTPSAPYAIITFPFLFGVMFGDMGHGLMMLIFASVLIIFEKKLAKTKAGGEVGINWSNDDIRLHCVGLFTLHVCV